MENILSPAKGIPLDEIPYVVAQLLVINGILLILNIILILIFLWKTNWDKDDT